MKCRLKSFGAALASMVFFAMTVCGQPADKRTLTLDRIFSSRDFRSETFGPARWLDDGSSYTTLEPSPANKEARDIVRYEAATGVRSVLIAALSLTPKGASTPLEIDDLFGLTMAGSSWSLPTPGRFGGKIRVETIGSLKSIRRS